MLHLKPMYILFCIITSARTSSTPTTDDYLLFEESLGNCSELSLLLISFALCTFKCRFTLSLSSSVMYVFEFNRDRLHSTGLYPGRSFKFVVSQSELSVEYLLKRKPIKIHRRL